jgi:hypothetical protein
MGSSEPSNVDITQAHSAQMWWIEKAGCILQHQGSKATTSGRYSNNVRAVEQQRPDSRATPPLSLLRGLTISISYETACAELCRSHLALDEVKPVCSITRISTLCMSKSGRAWCGTMPQSLVPKLDEVRPLYYTTSISTLCMSRAGRA